MGSREKGKILGSTLGKWSFGLDIVLFPQHHLRGEERPKSGHCESLHGAKRPRTQEETRKKVSPLAGCASGAWAHPVCCFSHLLVRLPVKWHCSNEALTGQGATETVPSWQDSAVAGSG